MIALLRENSKHTRISVRITDSNNILLIYVESKLATGGYHCQQVWVIQPHLDSSIGISLEYYPAFISLIGKIVVTIRLYAKEIIVSTERIVILVNSIRAEDQSALISLYDGHLYLIGEIGKIAKVVTLSEARIETRL